MPPPIPDVTVGDNPMYMSSDRVPGATPGGIAPKGTLTRQFMNPLYDYADEDDDEPMADYPPVRGMRTAMINTSPEDEMRYVSGP